MNRSAQENVRKMPMNPPDVSPQFPGFAPQDCTDFSEKSQDDPCFRVQAAFTIRKVCLPDEQTALRMVCHSKPVVAHGGD
jgi:hypothetical protein